MAQGRGMPLAGVNVLELAGIGAVPFCTMALRRLGAAVARVVRPNAEASREAAHRVHNEGKTALVFDLQDPHERDKLREQIGAYDVVVEGMLPGSAERLGLGPDDCFKVNPAVIYARVTGYGQEGQLSNVPGHDINFLAESGVLHMITPPGSKPRAPGNLLADFAAGGLAGALAIAASLGEAQKTGEGRVLDIAMVDTLESFLGMHEAMVEYGRGVDPITAPAPFYDTYECADGNYIAVGSIEPKFFEVLASELGLDEKWISLRQDPQRWPELRALLGAAFRRHELSHWVQNRNLMRACVSPVKDATGSGSAGAAGG